LDLGLEYEFLELLIDFLALLLPKLGQKTQILYRYARPFPRVSLNNLPFIGPSLVSRNAKKSINTAKKSKHGLKSKKTWCHIRLCGS